MGESCTDVDHTIPLENWRKTKLIICSLTTEPHESAWKNCTCTYSQQLIQWNLRSVLLARTSVGECDLYSLFSKIKTMYFFPIFLGDSLALFKHSPAVLSFSKLKMWGENYYRIRLQITWLSARAVYYLLC